MDEKPKFIADEGFDKAIVLLVREDYDVLYILEMMPGISDDVILEKSRDEERILLTLDKDFGELVFRLHHKHSGVILCRLEGLSEEDKCSLVKSTIDKYGNELYDSFTVIQPGNIRIRNKQP
jgi:predicted nuclease of predicted toxin-antitoxin system